MSFVYNKSIKRSGNLNIFHLENNFVFNQNNFLNYDDLKSNIYEYNSRIHSNNIEVNLKERDNFELLNKGQKF